MIILKIAEALNRKDERGFTLIELLVVIAILAILAAIAIPLVGSRVDQARVTADIANVRSLQGAVDLWVVDNDDTTNTLDTDGEDWIAQLQSEDYLLEDVKSPFANGAYSLTFENSVYKVESNMKETKWPKDDGE